jgi:hypothetical protein
VGNFKELEGRGFLGGGALGFSGAWVGNFHSCREGTFQELSGGNLSGDGAWVFQDVEGGDFQELWSGCLGSGRSGF